MARGGEGKLRSTKSIKAVRLRKRYPEMTLQQIADKVGLTRQGVSIVLVQQGIAPGKHLWSKKRRSCKVCGSLTSINTGDARTYCSAECYSKDHRVIVICVQCRKQFSTRKSLFNRSTLHFCNNYCRGKYIGLHYGFGTH